MDLECGPGAPGSRLSFCIAPSLHGCTKINSTYLLKDHNPTSRRNAIPSDGTVEKESDDESSHSKLADAEIVLDLLRFSGDATIVAAKLDGTVRWFGVTGLPPEAFSQTDRI